MKDMLADFYVGGLKLQVSIANQFVRQRPKKENCAYFDS